jgi:CDP-diacylglycerol--glycerol-3-phosphate 3-phosphatidyltransferase
MRRRLPLFNLANSLTLSRFAFAPVILYLVQQMRDPEFSPGAWKISLAALIVLVVTLLTDLFDGMVARARGEVTNFGKIMDPVADSTFFMTLMFGLSACERFGEDVSLWFPILILYREIAMHILRRYAALKGHAAPAKRSGKIKTFSQGVFISAFFLLTFLRDWTHDAGWGNSFLGEDFLRLFVFAVSVYTVAVTYWSLIEYSKDVPELVAEYAENKPDSEGAPE